MFAFLNNLKLNNNPPLVTKQGQYLSAEGYLFC